MSIATTGGPGVMTVGGVDYPFKTWSFTAQPPADLAPVEERFAGFAAGTVTFEGTFTSAYIPASFDVMAAILRGRRRRENGKGG